jgi:hypothetical protein
LIVVREITPQLRREKMLTKLETTVYQAAVEICLGGDYSVDAKDLAAQTGLDVKTVKGVMGSLVKKDRMVSNGAEIRGGQVFYDAFPKNDSGQICSFGEWQ